MRTNVLAGVSYAAILLSSLCANAWGDTSAMSEDAAAASKTGASIDDQGNQVLPAEACATVADAKFAQWNQRRFMMQETETFADGRKKTVEAIFTPDVAYARVDGGPWSSMNLVRAERSAPSADYLAKRMGLQSCSRGGADANTKQPVSTYSYAYLPDANAGEVTGKMWIDDSSQLPVRQELAQSVSSQRNLPISMEATYTYGDAVTVPADAVRSDERRRWIQQQIFLGNVPSTSGSEPGTTSFSGRRH